MTRTADIVICGAGITGVAAAYYLSKAGIKDILLLDERPVLSLTSDRSTECYRNWWPDSAMLALMNHSIDLMDGLAEESGNVFRMNRRGYLYVTGDESKMTGLIERSERISKLGAGLLRVHSADGQSSYQPAPPEGYKDQPTGADLLLGGDLIHRHFPYLTQNAVAALHVRRAGWLSAQQLGMYLFEAARERGVRYESARVESIEVKDNCVCGVKLASGESIHTPMLINAAGPFLKYVGRMLGIELPVQTELHMKAAIRDSLSVVGRQAPLLIWEDSQFLPWDEDEREALSADDETRWLAEPFPSGVHTRPEGSDESQTILMLWEYRSQVTEPDWPPPLDLQYPEIVLRGLTALLPRMKEYYSRMPRPQVDGGYYTKTPDNKPLIGRSEVEGAYLIGAVSGYGIMSACGAGDLLSKQIVGASLPSYAGAFEFSRFKDADYIRQIDNMNADGQL